jgi:periplasmic divalent cation tolerance protein
MNAGKPAMTLRIAWTTVETSDDAGQLANGIMESKLAACVQIDGPVRSVYPWKGRIESAEEYRLWIKYPAKNEAELQRLVHRVHPYEVPQWVAVDSAAVSDAYLEWIRNETN